MSLFHARYRCSQARVRRPQGFARVHAALSTLAATLWFAPPAWAHDPIVAGYLEHAFFKDSNILFEAKLDSGANSSSINAANNEVYKRRGRRWVKLSLKNKKGETYNIDAPVKKTITIRRAGASKQERLVIELTVCVGGRTELTEFTLADRTGQSYQVLIGRKFMADQILIKSSETYLVSGRCKAGE